MFKNKSKKAVSLTEVMIVVTIVAIIASIFLAMPRKNVTKTDKVKYYVAYNMLNTMQNERLRRNGNANLNNFCNTVNDWLNVTPNNAACTCNGTPNCVTLVNGMNMLWPNIAAGHVTIDLDGLGNGLDASKRDQHEFTLHPDATVTGTPLVEPDTTNDANGQGAGLNSTWCEFRVYQLDAADAHKNYTNGTIRNTYQSALTTYNTCNNNHDNSCFIEIIKQDIKN